MNDNNALTEAVYYILLSLCKPQHGYGIMQKTQQLSQGRVRLAAGTLYGALTTLCSKEWITSIASEKESRRKEYIITDSGRKVLENELKRLKQLVANGNEILKGDELE